MKLPAGLKAQSHMTASVAVPAAAGSMTRRLSQYTSARIATAHTMPSA